MQENRDAAASYIGRNLLAALLDEWKVAQAPWQQMSKEQQDDALGRLTTRLQSSIRQAFTIMFAGDLPAISAELGKVTFTAKGISCGLVIDRQSRARHDLADYAALGSNVIVLMVDPEEYFAGMTDAKNTSAQVDMFPDDGENRLHIDLDDDGLEAGEHVDPETGEIIADAATAPAAPSLVDRLGQLGINLPDDHELWTTISPTDLSHVMNFVDDRLKNGIKRAPPDVLKPHCPPELLANVSKFDHELLELVGALQANGVERELLSDDTVTAWSPDQRQDLWDWIEVKEAETSTPEDFPKETQEGRARALELLEQLRKVSAENDTTAAVSAETPSGDTQAPPVARAETAPGPTPSLADLKAALLAIGIEVPGKVCSSWAPWKVSAVAQYIDEFENGTGPATLPAFLEEYVVTGLQSQAGTREPDKWDLALNTPSLFASHLKEHHIEVPEHEVYAWTTEQRREVVAWMRSIVRAGQLEKEGFAILVGEQVAEEGQDPAKVYHVTLAPAVLDPWLKTKHSEGKPPLNETDVTAGAATEPNAGTDSSTAPKKRARKKRTKATTDTTEQPPATP